MSRYRVDRPEAQAKIDALRVAFHGVGALGLLLGASLPISTANSQEVAARGLEEVVVTARRREERAQSVPVSVSVVSGDALQNYNIEQFSDLQKIIPTLQMNDGTGRRNAPNYAIRGIRPTESLYGQDPSVAAYFAEVVMSPAEGGNLALYDLESVQVLKGPQGTLFGRNTNGGAVLFTPKRPGDSFGGETTVGYGNLNTIEAEVGIDLPAGDRFRTRVAARKFMRDGHQKDALNGREYGGEDTSAARVSAIWDITDQVENYTIATWDQARSEGRAGVIVAINPARFPPTSPIAQSLERQQARAIDTVEADFPQFEHVDAWGVFNATTVDLGAGMTLKNIAGYRDMEYESSYDQDASSAPLILSSIQRANLRHWSNELQLLGTAFDDTLSWQTGLYYYHEEGEQLADGRVFGGVQFVGGSIENDSYSIFAQGTYRFTSAWSMTFGGRYTRDDKEAAVVNRTATACNIRDDAGATLPLSQCFRNASDTFSAPTGTISLEYTPNDDALLYLASRRGYRSGGFNLRATFADTWTPFDEETVTDLELGAKIDWGIGDWQFRSNVALFYQWYEDVQRSVSRLIDGAGGGSAVAVGIYNAAEASVPGAEVELTIAPTQALTFMINYAYLDPEYKRWSDTVLVDGQPVERDLTATPFQYVPNHQGSATVRYELPIDATSGTLALQATWSARSEVYVNSLATIADIQLVPPELQWTIKQDSYDFIDLSATWTDVMGSPLELSAYVKNATDERYAVGSISSYGAIGYNALIYNDPRTYGAQMRYRF